MIEYSLNKDTSVLKQYVMSKDTEEKALRIHNEQIMDSFIDSVSDYKTKSSVSQYVPSNAAYKTLRLIDKKMSLGSKK